MNDFDQEQQKLIDEVEQERMREMSLMGIKGDHEAQRNNLDREEETNEEINAKLERMLGEAPLPQLTPE